LIWTFQFLLSSRVVVFDNKGILDFKETNLKKKKKKNFFFLRAKTKEEKRRNREREKEKLIREKTTTS